MKNIFPIMIGLFIILSFLAPVALSQEATTGSNDGGTSIQNESQSPFRGDSQDLTTSPKSMGEQEGNLYMNWNEVVPPEAGNSFAGPAAQRPLGRTGDTCMDIAGTWC